MIKRTRKILNKTQLAILVSLFFLIGSICTTQYLAWKFIYNSVLGEPLFGIFYAPYKWIIWSYDYYHTNYEAIQFGFSIFSLSSGICILFLTYYQLIAKRQANAISDLHGSAHWAELEEIKKAGLLAEDGVYVGAWIDKKGNTHYLRHDGPEHAIALAPTRSGKGVGLVLPTLLSWKHSAIIYDIKGENWALSAGWRKQYNNNVVLCFDPSSDAGNSCKYNPLSTIRLDTAKAVGDAQNIAIMIVDPDGKGLESHWDKTAFSLLTGVILHCMFKIRNEENRTANLTDVANVLSNPNKPIKDTLEEMLEYPHVDNQPFPFVAQEARTMLNKAEEELSSVVSTAVANLSLYRDPVVSQNIAYSSFSIDDLMNHEKPVSLYIVDRPSDKERMRPLIRLLITQVIRFHTEKMEFKDGSSVKGYKHRLLLLLDEFASLKKLTMVEEGLAFMAGYGIKAYLICQDSEQLFAVYGKNENIIANSHIRIAYAPNKLETAELISKMSGTATVIKEDISISGNRFAMFANHYSKTLRETQRSLITPDEVMRLAKPTKNDKGEITSSGEMLIFSAGYAAVKGTQILYFNDKYFSARAKIPAPEVSDEIIPTPKLTNTQSEQNSTDEGEINSEDTVTNNPYMDTLNAFDGKIL